MTYEFRLSDLGEGIAEAELRKWLVHEGERITEPQPVLEVETDKAVMDVEAVASGVVVELCAAVDDSVAVGQIIAVLEVDAIA